MTLPTTGQMNAEMISAELGRATTTTMSMDESAIRSMAGKLTAGSAVAMQDFYGKSKDVPYYIGTMTIGYNAGSGYPYCGFVSGSGGMGARNPTTISGFSFDWLLAYGTTGNTDSVIVTGNATAQPWATGNAKITIDGYGTLPMGVGTYDSKLNWTQFFIGTAPALYNWLYARIGTTVGLRIAV